MAPNGYEHLAMAQRLLLDPCMNATTLLDNVLQRQRINFTANAAALVVFAGGLLASLTSLLS